MTAAEWRASADPATMIRWLSRQGGFESLWDFVIGCSVRIRDRLPGPAFRRVLDLGAQVGRGVTWSAVDDALAEASDALDQLERKLRGPEQPAERQRLNREIGYGRAVFAFEFQDSEEAAAYISNHLLEWSPDPAAERREQADLLRRLVPDPSQRVLGEEKHDAEPGAAPDRGGTSAPQG